LIWFQSESCFLCPFTSGRCIKLFIGFITLKVYYLVYDPSEFCFPFGQRDFPLSVSLQNGIRFFTYPLPPRDLDFDYSRFTKEFDLSLDSVGLTLFYQLKFHDVVRTGIYFTIGLLFLRCDDWQTSQPPIYRFGSSLSQESFSSLTSDVI
jgi:hypothetical protein